MRTGCLRRISLTVAVVCLSASAFCLSGEQPKVVQPNVLAGTWYPEKAGELRSKTQAMLDDADLLPDMKVSALILPHAGYEYSGQTAACGVKAVGGEYNRVIIIGPSHYVTMVDTLSVPDVTHYATPLGEVPLDIEFIRRLKKNALFKTEPRAHQREHSVQIQLPLLQRWLAEFKLVPIVTGQCSPAVIEKAAKTLKELADERTVIIASSDFTHYGPNYGYVPFKEDVPKKIEELDMGAYRHIAALDAKGFIEYKEKTGATICGYVPVAVLLSMLEKGYTARVVKYTTSGRITGDFTNSVSYFAIAFRDERQAVQTGRPEEPVIELTAAEKDALLKLARRSLIYFLDNNKVPTAQDLNFEPSAAMKKTGAAFVTLKREGMLRGCIGHTLPIGPLYESVIQNAINAGVNDWRFMPVTKEEMGLLDVEISALSEPVRVFSYKDIRIGIDGVIFKKEGKAAVFLPQVARENNWNREIMLKNLSLKAGLDANAWREGGEYQIFQALVFSEEEK
jgi:AmmeMemoRadiSam system protein B/AmmeMemoRadiSam system protein A